MGGKSKKGGGVQADTAKQLAANEKHKVSNNSLMDMLGSLSGNQTNTLGPMFSQLVQNGLGFFGSNPNMPQGGQQSPWDMSAFQPKVQAMDDQYGKFKSRLGLFGHLMNGGNIGDWGGEEMNQFNPQAPQAPQQGAQGYNPYRFRGMR